MRKCACQCNISMDIALDLRSVLMPAVHLFLYFLVVYSNNKHIYFIVIFQPLLGHVLEHVFELRLIKSGSTNVSVCYFVQSFCPACHLSWDKDWSLSSLYRWKSMSPSPVKLCQVQWLYEVNSAVLFEHDIHFVIPVFFELPSWLPLVR